MGQPLLPLECLVAVEPSAEDGSRSAVFRNVGCDPDLPLARSWQGRTTLLQTFETTVEAHPNRPFLGTRPHDSSGDVARRYEWQTYWEASLIVQWLAKSMYAMGVRRGDRVGILGPNQPQWVQAMVACSKAAAVCVPLYPTFGLEAMSHVVAHSGMKAAFVHASNLRLLLEAVVSLGSAESAQPEGLDQGRAQHGEAPGAGSSGAGGGAGGKCDLKLVVVWGTESLSARDQQASGDAELVLMLWEEFVEVWGTPQHRNLDWGLAMSPPRAEDLCTIMYTSGTTGKPKGVMLTHRAMVSVIASQLAFLDDPWSRDKAAARQQREDAAYQQLLKADAGGQERKGGPQAHGAGAQERQREVGEMPAPLSAPGGSGIPGGRRAKYAEHLPKFDLATDSHLSYLPLAHIYERVLVETAIAIGASIGFWQGSVDKLQDDAQVLKPAMMVGVPRVWERVRESTWAKLRSRTAIARFLFRWFSHIKLRRLKAGAPQNRAFWLGDLLVFNKVKAALGGRLKLAVSGAAALSPEVEEFMRVSLGCVAGQGYGLTESCSATAVSWPDRWDMFGTVGPVQSCAEFCLVSVPEMGYDACPASPSRPPQGELCLRGPCLFSGYYKDLEATREAMDDQGFFHTGDIAQLEPSGALRIVDRKKNLIKLSQGEYVAVEKVEAVLRDCPLIAQAWVHAEPGGRRLMALLVPRFSSLMRWAHEHEALLTEGFGRMSLAPPAHAQDIADDEAGAEAAGTDFAHRRVGGLVDAAAGGMQPDLAPAEQRRVELLCSMPAVRAAVLEEARQASQRAGLAGFEMVHAVRVVPYEWTPANNLLTPTHKMMRHELRRRFQAEVRSMAVEIEGK